MHFGLHHYLAKLKNIGQRSRHEARVRSIVDRFMYVVGIAAPVMTVPQIAKIWYYQDAQGVSALSWSAYALGSFCWFIYGIVHKEKPIIFCNVVAAALQLAVVIGTLRFS